MYTIVPKTEIPEYRPLPGEPKPQIIDHRVEEKQNNQRTYKVKKSTKENLPQESSWKQRDALVAIETKYKHRIEELEKENAELLKAYEPTFQENKILKSHFEHGPDTAKLKRLQREKKELTSELEVVKEENALLLERVKELERKLRLEKDYYLQDKWQIALKRGRKRREDKAAGRVTQGPFHDAVKPEKRNFLDVDDEEFEERDERDLTIDNLEKETQILLNKIKQIKQHKESIDYMRFVGKGALTRNTTIANAVNDKLDRDIETFEIRLEKLRRKAKLLKIDSGEKEDDIDQVEDKHVVVETVKGKGTLNRPTNLSNKYFRSKETQTEQEDYNQIQTDKEIQKDVTKVSNNTKDKANANGIPAKSTTPNISSNSDSLPNSAKSVISNKPSKSQLSNGHPGSIKSNNLKQGREEILIDDDKSKNITKRNKSPLKETGLKSVKIERVHSPAETHWDHLAEQLVKTEKYVATSTSRPGQKTHRDIDRNSYKSSEKDYRRNAITETAKGTMSYQTSTPKRQIKFLKDLPQTAVSPILNDENGQDNQLQPGKNNSTTIIISQEYEEKINGNKTVPKTPRKTTNTGPAIDFVTKQHSWDTFTTPRHYNHIPQSERYNNGPEPIKSYRWKSDKDLTSPQKIIQEGKQRPGSWKSVSEKPSSITGSASSRYIDNRSQLDTTRTTQIGRLTEYDLVLADLKKQYKQQVLDSSDSKRQKQRGSESAWSREQMKVEEQMPSYQAVDFKSNGRTVNTTGGRSIMGNSGLRQERLLNLDLL